MLYRILDFMDTTLNIIGYVSTIIVLVECIIKLYSYVTKKRYVKMVLGFNKKRCFVSQAVYTNTTIPSRDVVSYSSVQAFQMINEMLNNVNYVIKPFSNSFEGENIIHIGGPAANIHVNALLAERIQRIRFCTTQKDQSIHQNLNLNQSCIEYSKEDTRCFKIGDKVLKLDSKIRDYGIFIKIPYNHREGIDYTTHIIFGGWANGTLKAFEFFTKNYKMIARKFKKSKYCFAIPINRIDNSFALITEKDIIDLTDEFFERNK